MKLIWEWILSFDITEGLVVLIAAILLIIGILRLGNLNDHNAAMVDRTCSEIHAQKVYVDSVSAVTAHIDSLRKIEYEKILIRAGVR